MPPASRTQRVGAARTISARTISLRAPEERAVAARDRAFGSWQRQSGCLLHSHRLEHAARVANEDFEDRRPPRIRRGCVASRRIRVQYRDDLATYADRKRHRVTLNRISGKGRKRRPISRIRRTRYRDVALEHGTGQPGLADAEIDRLGRGAIGSKTGKSPSSQSITFHEKHRRTVHFISGGLHETFEHLGESARFIEIANRVRESRRARKLRLITVRLRALDRLGGLLFAQRVRGCQSCNEDLLGLGCRAFADVFGFDCRAFTDLIGLGLGARDLAPRLIADVFDLRSRGVYFLSSVVRFLSSVHCLRLRLMNFSVRPFRFVVRLFQFVVCGFDLGVRLFDLHSRGVYFVSSLLCLCLRPMNFSVRPFRFAVRLFQFVVRGFDLGVRFFDLRARPFDFVLNGSPGCVELLLRLRAQVFERFPQLSDLPFRGALQSLGVLVGGRAKLRDLRFCLRTNISDERFRLATDLGRSRLRGRSDRELPLFH